VLMRGAGEGSWFHWIRRDDELMFRDWTYQTLGGLGRNGARFAFCIPEARAKSDVGGGSTQLAGSEGEDESR